MRTSEAVESLQDAMAKANAEFTRVEEKGEVSFQNVKFKYATLADILTMIRPPIAKYGLTIMQDAFMDGDFASVTTRVSHASGQWIESSSLRLRVLKDDPKLVGAALTYARRYSLSAFFSISGDAPDLDDIDTSKEPAKAPVARAAQPKPPVEKLEANTEQFQAEQAKVAELLQDIFRLTKLHGKDKISSILGVSPEKLSDMKRWNPFQLTTARDVIMKHISAEIAPSIPETTHEEAMLDA